MDGEYKTIDEYRRRLIQAFHSAGRSELISLVVLPTEKDIRLLESMLSDGNGRKWMETDGNGWQ